MSAEGLAVLAAQGVAHCPSLCGLWLGGKTSGCGCGCVCVRAHTCMQVWCGALVHVPVDVGDGGQGTGRCTICCPALCPYMCVSFYEYMGTCVCMRVCVHMDVVGAYIHI